MNVASGFFLISLFKKFRSFPVPTKSPYKAPILNAKHACFLPIKTKIPFIVIKMILKGKINLHLHIPGFTYSCHIEIEGPFSNFFTDGNCSHLKISRGNSPKFGRGSFPKRSMKRTEVLFLWYFHWLWFTFIQNPVL